MCTVILKSILSSHDVNITACRFPEEEEGDLFSNAVLITVWTVIKCKPLTGF